MAADQLDRVYMLDSTSQELIWIAGPLLLAALVVLSGPRAPLASCVIFSVAGTLAYLRNLSEKTPGRTPKSRVGRRLISKALVALLVAAGGYGIGAGCLTVALTAYSTAHHNPGLVGILVAVWGVGSILGGLAYGQRDWSGAPREQALLLLAAFGALLALLILGTSPATLAVIMLLLGLPLSPWLGTLNRAVQALAPQNRATEAFTWTIAIITTGIAAGDALAGIAVQRAGSQAAFALASIAALGGAAVGASGKIRRRRVRDRRGGQPKRHVSATTAPRGGPIK